MPLWGYLLLLAFVVIGLVATDQRRAVRLVVALVLVVVVVALAGYGGLH